MSKINDKYSNDSMCTKEVTRHLLNETEQAKPIEPIRSYTTWQGFRAQMFLALVIAIGTLGGGMPIGYSATLLPQLRSLNLSFQTDEEMGSWIASIHPLSAPIGCFIGGTLMEILGRKVTFQISCIPLACGWLLICFATNHALLLTGRALTGISVGVMGPSAQIYVAEVSDAKRRGVFSNIPGTSYTFGILVVYIIGAVCHWRTVAGISIIPAAAVFIMSFFLPESPVWLVKQGKIEDAKNASNWLRGGDSAQVTEEIQELMKRDQQVKLEQENHYQSSWTSFTTRQVLKPFLIVNTFNLLTTVTGSYILVFYTIDIIASVTEGKEVSEYFTAVLIGGVRFICSVISCILLQVINRRTLGIASAIGSAIPTISLALVLHFQDVHSIYLVSACLLSYVVANTLGLMVLSGIMVGEMFPIKIRGMAGSISVTIYQLLIFATTKVFPFLKNVLSIKGCFLCFGISSLFAAIFIYMVVPETKGKTLYEIEDYFFQDNVLWITRDRVEKRNNTLNSTN